MRKVIIKLTYIAIIEAAGLLLMQGCKRHSAPTPAQPVVRSAPKVKLPDVPGPLPVENTAPAPERPTRRLRTVQPQRQPAEVPAVPTEVIQQRRDARLLRQQQAASQAQQRELNQQVEQETQQRRQIQDEPRIQDAPEPPGSSGLGPDAPRIQDAPGPDQGQPGQLPPRIQDAPGPDQTQPQPPPQEHP